MAKAADREPREEKSCPLPSAHTRLHQCHDLWHRLVAAYPDPDEFVLQLNQFLTTLRQVTFMVQTQKAKFNDFDTWYGTKDVQGEWQKRMAADPLMVWLRDARNTVEKQGDLDLASTARVRVVANWLDRRDMEFEVPPLMGPEEIAASLETKGLPAEVRKDGVIEVERRWVSKDLPDHDLAEVCAHGYGVLSTFLAQAHAKLGYTMRTFGGETHEGRHDRTAHLGGKLPCMVVSPEMRIARIHLASGELVWVEEKSIPYSKKDRAWFEERKKDMTIGQVELMPRPDEDPLDVGARWSSVARRTLAHDGYHRPMAFLLSTRRDMFVPLQFDFHDQAEKYLAYDRVAREVNERGSDLVVFINESWDAVVPMREFGPDMVPARERPDRGEGLAVTVACADDRFRTYWSRVTRDKQNRPVLGKEEVNEQKDLVLNVLAPLRAVWAKWPKQNEVEGASEE